MSPWNKRFEFLDEGKGYVVKEGTLLCFHLTARQSESQSHLSDYPSRASDYASVSIPHFNSGLKNDGAQGLPSTLEQSTVPSTHKKTLSDCYQSAHHMLGLSSSAYQNFPAL